MCLSLRPCLSAVQDVFSSRNWFGCCSKLTPFGLLEGRFLTTLHTRSTSIFAEFWNPFQMFSVGSIAVFLSHLRTLIYRTESMLGSTCCIAAIGAPSCRLYACCLVHLRRKPFLPCWICLDLLVIYSFIFIMFKCYALLLIFFVMPAFHLICSCFIVEFQLLLLSPCCSILYCSLLMSPCCSFI